MINKYSFALRFEGYPEIGLGAIFKKEEIRKIINSEFELPPIAIVSRETAPYVKDIYHGPVHILKSDTYSKEEIIELQDLGFLDIPWITGLIYNPAQYLNEINQTTKILAIEDRPTNDLDIWGILNHSPNKHWHASYTGISNQYLGPQYTILRESFLSVPQIKKQRAIAITLGGANESGSTYPIVAALADLEIPLKVILGPGFDNYLEQKMRDEFNQFDSIEIYKSPQNFIELLASSDVAILQGGSTVYESACLKIAPLYVSEDPHETELALSLEELGYGKHIGTAKDFSKELLIQEVKNLFDNEVELKKSQDQGRQLNVHQGRENFKDILNQLYNAKR